nr:hypothetical protein [Stigmatella aurantiaca]
MEDVPTALRAHDRKRCAREVDHAVEAGVDQCLELLRADLLERTHVAIASVVHEDVQPPEGIEGGPNGGGSLGFLADIEPPGPDSCAMALHEPRELGGLPRGRDDPVTRVERRLHDISTESIRASLLPPRTRQVFFALGLSSR